MGLGQSLSVFFPRDKSLSDAPGYLQQYKTANPRKTNRLICSHVRIPTTSLLPSILTLSDQQEGAD